VHCRWAMLGVAGVLGQEIFRPDVFWYEAGLPENLPGPFKNINMGGLLAWEFLLMHWVEVRRWQDIKKHGSVNEVRSKQASKQASSSSSRGPRCNSRSPAAIRRQRGSSLHTHTGGPRCNKGAAAQHSPVAAAAAAVTGSRQAPVACSSSSMQLPGAAATWQWR
jgi:hypothetical protein